jgi:hypothetical protein
MAVDSYLELFTTLFGWQWYGIIWDVLSDTGIIYIPFVVIIIETWREAARGGSYGNVHDLALRNMEIKFYVAIFVAIIAGPPTVTLNASMLSYQAPPSLLDPTPTAATTSAPQSTYGSSGAFSGAPSSVQLPIWWYTVLSLTKGINHAILAGIPNTIGIRQVQELARLSSISDPALRAEAARFYSECFVPARSKYLRDNPGGSTVTTILDEYGEDDPDWMGSHLYLALYYPNMRSIRQVAGWPYDSNRDVDYDPDLPHDLGQPWCSQWWIDPDKGLLARISALPEASSFQNGLANMASGMASWFPSMPYAARKARDNAVRKTLSNSMVEAMASYQPDNMESGSRGSALWGTAQSASAFAGAVSANFTFGAMLQALKPMLPIAQAILLMIVYALLPLIVVISGYSLSMLVLAGLGIFTINFWTVLWKLAQWIDENLMVAMFDGVGAIDRAMAALANDGFWGSTTKDFLIDTLFAMLVIGMPLIWTMLMGWVGIRIGKDLNNAFSNTTSSSQESGKKGPGTLSKLPRKGR